MKIAEPEVVSYGGLTTVTKYHMVRKDEHVVDSGERQGRAGRGCGANLPAFGNG